MPEQIETKMSPIEQDSMFENSHEVEAYVDSIREHYRLEHATYRGRRNESQSATAEIASEEARVLIDSTFLGIMALGETFEFREPSVLKHSVEEPVTITDELIDFEVAGISYAEFRSEFEKSIAAFAIITDRLSKSGYNVPEYIELNDQDRLSVATLMMSQYLELNALRFGVDSTNVKGIEHTENTSIYTGLTERQVRLIDKDKARHPNLITRNMRKRRLTAGVSSHHVVLKYSPKDYKVLRAAFPEENKDVFDHIVSFATNAREELEKRN
jgi:hypothetical protein